MLKVFFYQKTSKKISESERPRSLNGKITVYGIYSTSLYISGIENIFMNFTATIKIYKDKYQKQKVCPFKDGLKPGYWHYPIRVDHWAKNSIQLYYLFISRKQFFPSPGMCVQFFGDTVALPKNILPINKTMGLIVDHWEYCPLNTSKPVLQFFCDISSKYIAKVSANSVSYKTTIKTDSTHTPVIPEVLLPSYKADKISEIKEKVTLTGMSLIKDKHACSDVARLIVS